jgi:bifunctional N-acetylglucosamine-1-phosphate-uridyltransferase/glucosamine-1-phosphate-acetyltransferase GlmU-like protein
MNTHAIILAAGKGTRMNSEKPKVLYEVKGSVLIDRVLKSVSKVSHCPTIVVGYKGEEIIKHTKNRYHYVWQKEQLGSGHAVLCARESLAGDQPPPNPPRGRGLKSPQPPFAKGGKIENILIVYGDHPFISQETIERLVNSHVQKKAKLSMTTISVPNFEGRYKVFYDYGRVARDEDKNIKSIVEVKNASDEQKKIKELNVGYYCFDADWLWENIEKIKNDNNGKEYNLTDIVGIAIEQGIFINSISVEDPIEAVGVNSLEQLEAVEKSLG